MEISKEELINLLGDILKPQHYNHEFSWYDIQTAIIKSKSKLL